MKPRVDKLRVWGCQCWFFIPEHERRSKLSPRAFPAIHLGLDDERNGYIIYVPDLNRITSSYHLTFQERKFITFTNEGVVNKPRTIRPLVDRDEIPLHDEPFTSPHANDDTDDDDHEDVHGYREPPLRTYRELPLRAMDHGIRDEDDHDAPNEQRRSPRLVNVPSPDYTRRNYFEPHTQSVVLEDVNGHMCIVRTEDLLTNIKTPDTFEEATKSRYSERWYESMQKEITDLIGNKTWT